MSLTEQEFQFNNLWDIGDYNLQNYALCGLVHRNKTIIKQNCNYNWDYFVNIYGESIKVCKQFLVSLLQISRKRIEILQLKIVRGINLLNVK
jgi:hypothetical protein